MQAINGTLDHMNPSLYVQDISFLKSVDFFVFSSAHGTFLKIYYILNHISSIDKFKKINKNHSNILSHHEDEMVG